MKQITDFLVGLRSLAASIVVITVSIALITILYRQLSSSAIIVEPIRVPGALEKSGYTPEITAQRLMDSMFLIQQQASTQKEGAPVAPEWQRFDMEVPGSGITIGTLGNVLRESMGIREQKITGEIISSDSGLQLRLRLLGTMQFKDSDSHEPHEVDTLLKASAEQAVQLIDPFMYASYLYAHGKTNELTKALAYCFDHCSDENKAWAHNLSGVQLAINKDWDGAIEAYKRALELKEGFAIAYHNWGNALREQGKYTMASKKFQRAGKLDSDLYRKEDQAKIMVAIGVQMHKHAKQIEKEEDREKLKEKEIEQYRLALKLNPNEAKAYLFWGKALMGGTNPNYKSSTEKFAKAVEKTRIQKPDDVEALAEIFSLWGNVLVKLEEYKDAICKYQSALQANKKDFGFLEKKIVKIKKKIPIDDQSSSNYCP